MRDDRWVIWEYLLFPRRLGIPRISCEVTTLLDTKEATWESFPAIKKKTKLGWELDSL